MAVVFAKTVKGQSEMEARTRDLTPRVRRVLICVDGKRSVDELRAMTADDAIEQTLSVLEAQGYIEAVSGVGGSAPVAAVSARPVAPQPQSSATVFRDLTDDDPLNLAKARNFMANTINVLVGSIGTSGLLDHIQQAESHEDLRALFDDWFSAISTSRDGRREAATLRTKLLEII